MNIDERLEALAHSVELIAQMQLKTDEQMEKTSQIVGQLSKDIIQQGKETQKQMQMLRKFFSRIMADHELRIQTLESEESAG